MTQHKPLTLISRAVGCATKLRADVLARVLDDLVPEAAGSSWEIGLHEDAGAYHLDDRSLVVSVDFITPVLDDPEVFGQVAVVHALSDLYAKGAEPLFAVNVAGFPVDAMDPADMAAVLRGGAGKAREAGLAILGGHTIDSPEPFYGLACVGVVGQGRFVGNTGARPGDRLVLTKPIGTGIILHFCARARLDDSGALTEATASMLQLSDGAARAMQDVGARACTDVTGFGLLGHLCQLMEASGATAEINHAAVPVLRGGRDMLDSALNYCFIKTNQERFAHRVLWRASGPVSGGDILYASETSGGLLVAVPPAGAERMIERARAAGCPWTAEIGSVVARPNDDTLIVVE